MNDPLSEVIALLQPRAVFSRRISGAGRWGVRYSEFGHPSFCAVLAALIGLSPSYFGRVFKASTGTTPHRWLVNARVRRAQQILLETEASLVDVALASGFSDQSHLSRAFCGVTGQTPGAWRRDHQR